MEQNIQQTVKNKLPVRTKTATLGIKIFEFMKNNKSAIVFFLISFWLGYSIIYDYYYKPCYNPRCDFVFPVLGLIICMIVITFIPLFSIFFNKSVSILGALVSFVTSLILGFFSFVLFFLSFNFFSDLNHMMSENPPDSTAVFNRAVIFAVLVSVLIFILTKIAWFLSKNIFPRMPK